jgi:hypothetical protein
MFSGMLVSDSMGSLLAKLFRLPSQGKPISIVDVSGVPSEVTSVVVSVLARMVFDYAIWSRTEAQKPLLLVCEEAHRYVPKDENAENGQAVRKILERIAKEGRKYGVSLGLITQRPSDLAEGVLSQCGTIVSMRLNNDRDQACVRAAMPEGELAAGGEHPPRLGEHLVDLFRRGVERRIADHRVEAPAREWQIGPVAEDRAPSLAVAGPDVGQHARRIVDGGQFTSEHGQFGRDAEEQDALVVACRGPAEILDVARRRPQRRAETRMDAREIAPVPGRK